MTGSNTYDNICDEFPVKVIFNGYDSYWKGVNEYPIMLKKNHSKLCFSYERYWFVYGKQKFIHIYETPCSKYVYFLAEIKTMKYMTLSKNKIRLWDDKKDFNIKFENSEDKLYFDEYYKTKVNS